MRRVFLSLMLVAAPLQAQKLTDNDTLVRVTSAAPRPANDLRDFLMNSFGRPGDRSMTRAANVDALGEVPDSSWFQNRHGRLRMSREALVRGPNTTDGPSMEGPWEVIAIKDEGVSPGFRIRDVHGQVYLLKFDPLKHPEMATGAEVISTKFFHAMGFNVPENFIARFERGRLVPAAGTTMSKRKIDGVLRRVPRSRDGVYRAVASKFLSGKPLGPFEYHGTRPDDPNDIFPHENRRELRGLRLMAAWLNHDDSRSINTLDMLVSEGERRFIRHYLIDFGSTLGSGTWGPQKPIAGWQHFWEPRIALTRLLTLGIVDRPWIRAKYVKAPSLGKLEFDLFNPAKWKPTFPNPAFANATAADLYWAARIVTAFTDDDIRAIVAAGELSDPRAAETLVRWLIGRRDRIGRYAFGLAPSFDNFDWSETTGLRFDHLASLRGLSPAPGGVTVAWSGCGEGCRRARVLAEGDERAAYVTLRKIDGREDIVAIARDGEGGL
jgi:hypothetical protein